MAETRQTSWLEVEHDRRGRKELGRVPRGWMAARPDLYPERCREAEPAPAWRLRREQCGWASTRWGGRTLGEGHFGKVRLARHANTGRPFAIKILDRQCILAMKTDEQVRAPFCPIHGSILGFFRLACSLVAAVAHIKTKIMTLKLLKHPNVVRLYEDYLVGAHGAQ
ncbi:hypothetical protein ZWY2020_041129 [Hordeum vulgare]|nr:hypothetical protein ZWY2020_041129 [Hordeum vulgare]